MAKNTIYASYLVRVWGEDQQSELGNWCGEVESIQTGRKWQFADSSAMFDFLQAQLLAEPAKQSGPQNH